MASPPDLPHIPLLSSNAVLDIDDLEGKRLNIYVPCGDLVDGDEVELLWWGCAADGAAVDIYEAVRFFEGDTVIPEPVVPGWPEGQTALPFSASHDRIILLDQGHVFCSYRVQKQDGSDAVESYRLSFRVGYKALELPLAQLVQSHAGWVADDLDSYTLVVPPVNSMEVGDEVTMVVDGYSDFYDAPPWEQKKVLGEGDLNTVLSWNLDPTYVAFLIDGRLDISYSVSYRNIATEVSHSRVHALRLGAPAQPPLPLLAKPQITGHTGELLNPDDFPNGLQVTIGLHSGAQIGDVLVLHWQGATERASTRKSLILDISNIHSGRLAFDIEPHWLTDNFGQAVKVFCHYARLGRNQRSEPLQLRIRVPLNLPPLSVVGATLLDDQTYTIKAVALMRGVTVVVPNEANYGPDDLVSVTWAAPGSGHHTATTPTVVGGRTYEIPPQHVPAAMDQQIEVFYTVEQDGTTQNSRPYVLCVEKLAPTDVRPVRSDHIDGDTLTLSRMPATGTALEQPAWVFKAPSQWLSMRLEGISTADSPLTEIIAANTPVTGTALESHSEHVGKRVFESFKRDTQLNIYVTVLFEPGQAPVSLRTLSITVRD